MAVYKYNSQNDELKRVAGGTLYADCPIGSYIPFGGTAIPTGWLLCNGQAVSRTDYADLFAVIGTAYGSGDGSTTFNIPDLRESVPKGAGLTGLSNNHLDADGLAVGEFIDDRIQEHQHNTLVTGASGSTILVTGTGVAGDGTTNQYLTLGVINARIGDTTEVKSVGSNYIIKAKQIGAPADFVDAIDNVIEEKFSYSTTEVNTGKKWIDGKDVYQKVIDCGALPNNTIKSVAHNITNLGDYCKVSGQVKNTTGTSFPIPHAEATANQNINVFMDNTNVNIETYSDRSGLTGWLILEYTKS